MINDIEALLARWWYYTAELAPGRFAKGQYPDHIPMLPRLALRGVDLRGADCLDVGAMEGIIPVLMKRRGANRVLALDATPHCAEKMAALKRAYGVEFDFAQVGLMYDLSKRMQAVPAFDLINLSGLLYHVFSPMHVMAGIRPVLKRNGLMIVSTNVVRRDDYTVEYNARGRLHGEANTFWYHSAPALEHMIRLFNLEPIDCMFYPHAEGLLNIDKTEMDTGYMTVVCRAIDPAQAAAFDPWIGRVQQVSWEYRGLCDMTREEAQPLSSIGYAGRSAGVREGGLDLLAAAYDERHIVTAAATLADAHALSLADQS
jgi:SAM-dependent methyltransferase